MTTQKSPYPNVPQQAKYPELEERVLKYWNDNSIFESSVSNRTNSKAGEFVFYDGPPFANGMPHYGHLLTGYVKDLIPRYQTMRGKRVERRFGWDCHGLPPEMEAEKELKVSGRLAIQEFGIQKFNEHCRTSVMRYTKEWEYFVNRQARWVDFRNDYKTMDLSYMESIMWAFKELWKKGLIYEGYRVMPYSWACETPLSNFEIRMDNATRPRQDPAITVAFNLEPTPAESGKTIKILVWTTTPWTLPSNLALAVGEEIDYAIFEEGNTQFILAAGVVAKYKEQLKNATQVGSIKGSALVGRAYTPIFNYAPSHPKIYRIYSGEFVSTEDGTGVVHMAPGFGEDDFNLCQKHGLPVFVPVDHQGKFTAEVRDYQGLQVFDANKEIIKTLKDQGVLIRHDAITHNYPHCWRTDTPIIYRAMNSWYVEVSKIKDRMIELNQKIKWVPEHIRDGQFGNGLKNAPDWSISRNRFWGSPIPVWRSDDPKYPRIDVYGSLDELERDFGVRPNDLHRPYIDELVRPNPDDPTGKSMMRRVSDVLDCWFESGSMPFAQVHYPFENKEWFEKHFPGDFIVEYVAQTRGWFYTLMVMGTALFDCAPFKNCVCHGVVLDENGQKLSKRLRNYPSPEEVFATLGSDALRWFLMSSSILRGQDLEIDREGKGIAEVVRTALNPIWNVYYFFTLYANADQVKAEWSVSSDQVLDRYILSKTHQLVAQAQSSLDQFDIAGACGQVSRFLDVLNNWYVRRSRERFWRSEKGPEKLAAYNTLYTVLCELCKVCAPLLPLLTEEIYRGLTGAVSVHLESWPEQAKLPFDKELVAVMDRVREVCSAGLSIREANNLRTRLPLATLTIAGAGSAKLAPFTELLKDELNVKSVKFADRIDQFAELTLQVNARQLGPRLGGKVQQVIKEAKSGNYKVVGDSVEIAGVVLAAGEFELGLRAKEGVAAQSVAGHEMVAVLDVQITKELQDEGVARDLVRLVQQARKSAGLHVADHIQLGLETSPGVRSALSNFERYLCEQTLADELSWSELASAQYSETQKIGEDQVRLSLKRCQ